MLLACFIIQHCGITQYTVQQHDQHIGTRARILKHFEMMVELKVRLQGFQIILQIFSIENVSAESFNIIFIYKYNC